MSDLTPVSEDTEITLGTGKMLVVFFGLVALCAAFFGLGYKLGKSSQVTAAVVEATPTAGGPTRPAGAKPPADSTTDHSADVAYYQPSTPASASNQPAPAATSSSSTSPATNAASPDSTPPQNDPTVAPPTIGYYVQVAAVSKQEDADALVDALKKKQYPAFSSEGPDKLFHVAVGPFADVKNAEDMRAKLVSDGYNPILKK